MLLQHRKRGSDDERIAFKIGVRRQDVHVQPERAQGSVEFEAEPERIEGLALRLDAEHPLRFVGEKERHRGTARRAEGRLAISAATVRTSSAAGTHPWSGGEGPHASAPGPKGACRQRK
jgi:hypothetical protein